MSTGCEPAGKPPQQASLLVVTADAKAVPVTDHVEGTAGVRRIEISGERPQRHAVLRGEGLSVAAALFAVLQRGHVEALQGRRHCKLSAARAEFQQAHAGRVTAHFGSPLMVKGVNGVGVTAGQLVLKIVKTVGPVGHGASFRQGNGPTTRGGRRVV